MGKRLGRTRWHLEPPAVAAVEASLEAIEERDRKTLVHGGGPHGLRSRQVPSLLTELRPGVTEAEHDRGDGSARDEQGERETEGCERAG
jgi:hypothetical protein